MDTLKFVHQFVERHPLIEAAIQRHEDRAAIRPNNRVPCSTGLQLTWFEWQKLRKHPVTQCPPGIARGITLTHQARDSHMRRAREFREREFLRSMGWTD